MQQWEYMFVAAEYEGNLWRARYANGYELANWHRGPSVSAYANMLGAEGWELVTSMTVSAEGGTVAALLYHFKRLKVGGGL